MKNLITFFVSTLLTISGFAQYGQRQQYGSGQTITINFNGNGNNDGYRVVVDGTTYTSNTNNNGNWNRNTSNRQGDDDIIINNVRAGQHSIQVYRIRSNSRTNNRGYGNTASPVYSSTFTLRQGYDATLDIRSNGEVKFTEKRSNNNRDRRDNDDRDDRRNGGYNNGGYNNGGYNNGGYRTPMANYQFNELYEDVKGKWFQASKVTAVRDVFTNASTYFSTNQVTQLLQLISSESNRLELAKLSYRVVADPANFTQVYSLFSNQSYRNDLDRYVRGNRF